MASEWNFEQVSKDFIDYSRDDYDYDNLKLEENFNKAPPISVSEYRARTSEVLPRGIFDEVDVPGILIGTKDIPVNSVNKDVSPPITEKLQEKKSNYDYGDHIFINKDEPIAGCSTNSNNQNLIKENKKEQKKKKRKYKPFNTSNSSSNQSFNQPWTPNFAERFQDDDEFPPL